MHRRKQAIDVNRVFHALSDATRRGMIERLSGMCRMEPAGLSAVEQWIRDRRSLWERRFDRLGELLAEEDLPDVDT